MQGLEMRNQMMTTWRGKRKMKICTWNVRSIAGKETELVGGIKKLDVKILGVTETRKIGQGIEKLQDGYLLYYSGVPKTQTAKAGVRCIIHENLAGLITDWNSVSESILTVTVKLDKDQEEEGTQIIVT
jgi:exonuclease III